MKDRTNNELDPKVELASSWKPTAILKCNWSLKTEIMPSDMAFF